MHAARQGEGGLGSCRATARSFRGKGERFIHGDSSRGTWCIEAHERLAYLCTKECLLARGDVRRGGVGSGGRMKGGTVRMGTVEASMGTLRKDDGFTVLAVDRRRRGVRLNGCKLSGTFRGGEAARSGVCDPVRALFREKRLYLYFSCILIWGILHRRRRSEGNAEHYRIWGEGVRVCASRKRAHDTRKSMREK